MSDKNTSLAEMFSEQNLLNNTPVNPVTQLNTAYNAPTIKPLDMSNILQVNKNYLTSNTNQLQGAEAAETPWYKDGQAMSGYAGLASTLLQAASLPGQIKLAKLQRKSLEHNLNVAEDNQAFKQESRNSLRGENFFAKPNSVAGGEYV